MGGAGTFFDERLAFGPLIARARRKLFPSAGSFLLGEIALFSFIALVVTGIYLALFYRPAFAPAAGDARELPAAFASVLDLSLRVPFGLLVRRMHHFATHLFIASLLLHAARVFFTGAFRKPRELNWWLGLGLLGVALVNGFTGYCLPFDMRGGSALRMSLTTLESVPWVGPWLAALLFGAPFPGPFIASRLYIEHVLLGPALIALVLGAHLFLVVWQTHTDYPGPSRGPSTVVGGPAWPDQAARSITLALLLLSLLALLAAFFPAEAVWVYGPYRPATSYEPLSPDWFLMWVEGAYRLLPRQLDFHLIGANFTNPFYGAVLLPSLVFGMCAIYPLVDARVYAEAKAEAHVLERWWRRPFRTAFGLAGLLFLVLLSLASSDVWMAERAGTSLGRMRLVWGVITLGAPPLVFALTLGALRPIARAAEPPS